MVVNWPGSTPAGTVNHDLVDFSDFLPTFAELGGATIPPKLTLDGRSLAAQIRGQKGSPREWVYCELGGQAFVRDRRYKLTSGGELFDLRDAPFDEIAVPAPRPEEARAAAARLQAVLDQHQPAPRRGPNKTPAQNAKPRQQRKQQRRQGGLQAT
jgi:arylsulfatase A